MKFKLFALYITLKTIAMLPTKLRVSTCRGKIIITFEFDILTTRNFDARTTYVINEINKTTTRGNYNETRDRLRVA